MTKREVSNAYFNWMYHIVCNNRYSPNASYRKLFTRLHEIDFYYLIDMDDNRAGDGIDLRYRFGNECSYDHSLIAEYLDDRPCSVLEMLVALSIRCEEDIMDDPDIGDRTGKWFWDMIANLGLSSMNDIRYDERYVDDVVDRFLNREYRRNGEGGLFTIRNCDRDLRDVEIWYQMCWYLNSVV